MFDMRYHIASLVAVFLALTVGIVLGTSIVNRGVLVRQQTALVNSLRGEFATLRDRNRVLQDQANSDRQFFQSLLPVLIQRRLAKKRVAVVAGDSQDTRDVRSAVSALRQAGARVSVLTLSTPDLGTKDRTKAAKLSKIFVREDLDGDELRRRLVSEIATQTAKATEPAFLQQLGDIGIIRVSGATALPAQAVVVVAGSKTMVSDVQAPLIEQLIKIRVPVIGVETSAAKESAMQAYQDGGANTVDNIDSPIGQVSLVFSLSGSPGHYGTKGTADALAPKLEAR